MFAVASAAFLLQIPVVHVEAGLRTKDLTCPYPEEGFRQMVSRIAALHCAPTYTAQRNLEAELVTGRIVLTGNTVVDGLQQCLAKARWPWDKVDFSKKQVLVTCHGRENWGQKAADLVQTIRDLSYSPGVEFHVVLHLNPKARWPFESLRDLPNIHLHEPIGYFEMLGAIRGSAAIITDSGGLVEEAVTLGRPVLIYRDKTERMEAVAAGVAFMTPTGASVSLGLRDVLNSDFSGVPEVFGDGHAAERIVEAMKENKLS